MSVARDRLLAFRRSLPHTPKLERQTVRARGLAFAVFSTPPVGNATPVVCINGGMIVDHAMLWPALSPLAEARQVILYDQRGRGASEAPSDPLAARISDDVADLAALRRALGIRRWDLLGQSWGGGIAQLTAAEDAAGTRRLVLVDSVGPTNAWMGPLRTEVLARSSAEDRAVLLEADDAALATPNPAVHLAHLRAAYPAWFVDREFASTFPLPKTASPTGTAVLAQLRRDGYDWRDRVQLIAAPTLVVHGEGDAISPSVARELATIIPHTKRDSGFPTPGTSPSGSPRNPSLQLFQHFLRRSLMRQRMRFTVTVVLGLGGALALAHPGRNAPAPPPHPPRLALPTLVWIQPRSDMHDWRDADVDQARRAFAAWSGITPSIYFLHTSDSARATVRVWWSRSLSRSGEWRIATHPRSSLGRVTDASIELALHHRDGQPLDGNAIRALAMHEVGHLLGLGHSRDATSIMAPTVRVQVLSHGDSTGLLRLFAPAVGEP